ncbi:OmpA/MotB family protein [Campylobacter fetus]|uniref:OmpA/MotB family protein n=1 Tax=Campylobacter fetus TaxID=196 RepID=UPI000FCB33CE|nr:OmpA family protein [Campylobacter fetus]QQF52438.1 OmpA family protein [Campylobacter fetus subsp. venerealis]RUT49268.1 hypothetical protein BWK67_06815 [Campylobacter fetus]RUT49528.1 hypothetical protein BWK51_06795 [Campylobacter fetus]
MLDRLFSKKQEGGDYWIALSDIMTALMLIFLLMSVIYMIKVEDSVKIPRIFKETSQGLSQKLNKEFEQNLKTWGAVIDKDLTIRFGQPDVLFAVGSSELSGKFKEILNEFFQRYLKIIMSDEFKNNIEEIRIEGHTSSVWGNEELNLAYFKNMRLSSDRARSVLEYLLINSNDQEKEFLKKHFRSIGFSSSMPLDINGNHTSKSGLKEDFTNSQRVEFRVRTNIESKVSRIIEQNERK